MQDKLAALSIYLLYGLTLAFWPVFSEYLYKYLEKQNYLVRLIPQKKYYYKIISLLIFSLFVIWCTREYKTLNLLSTFFIISIGISIEKNRLNILTSLLIFCSLCMWGSILWWVRGPEDISKFFSPINLVIFAIAVIFFARLLLYPTLIYKNKSFNWVPIYFFTIVAIFLSFSIGILDDPNQLLTEWHHWSAYIGPAELVLSGAIVMHDFPAQYGLGPTLLLANFCGNNCWFGMFFIVAIANLIFSFAIFLIALSLTRNCRSNQLIVALLCLVVCFFWNAYPPNVGSPSITPSVAGLRFLPVMLLVIYLYFSKEIQLSYVKIYIAHILWLFGFLWSPESAFYVTYVWGSFYIFIFRSKDNYLVNFKKLLLNLLTLLISWCILILLFLVLFISIYKVMPTIDGYLAYALYPPGVMPINYRGGIWFVIFVGILGLLTLFCFLKNSGNSVHFRRSFLLLLLFYSVLSYFMGRSHDNNLLNLMPFTVLVLLSLRQFTNLSFLNPIANTLCAALLGGLVFFGWDSWALFMKNSPELNVFNPHLISNSVSITNINTEKLLNARYKTDQSINPYGDASKAVNFIRENYGESFTILDYSMSLERGSPQSAWSAFHNPANLFYVPSNIRRVFLQNTADSLKIPGWLIINSKYPAKPWLDDLDSVYSRTEKIEFGEFYAIRFIPRIN